MKKCCPTFLLTDQLADFGTTDKNRKCIATFECDGKNFIHSYEECNKGYYVTCGNKYLPEFFFLIICYIKVVKLEILL